MADSKKKQAAKKKPAAKQNPVMKDGEVRMATEAENRKDVLAAQPEKDELQLKREAVAKAGLAHGSLNGYQPQKKEEFSQAEREGDDAAPGADNQSPASKNAPINKEGNQPKTEPAVPSDPPREPGV